MSSNKLTLYFNPVSSPSRSVKIFLDACNIPYEGKSLDFQKAEHKAPEYLAINPRGQLPVSYLFKKTSSFRDEMIVPCGDKDARASVYLLQYPRCRVLSSLYYS